MRVTWWCHMGEHWEWEEGVQGIVMSRKVTNLSNLSTSIKEKKNYDDNTLHIYTTCLFLWTFFNVFGWCLLSSDFGQKLFCYVTCEASLSSLEVVPLQITPNLQIYDAFWSLWKWILTDCNRVIKAKLHLPFKKFISRSYEHLSQWAFLHIFFEQIQPVKCGTKNNASEASQSNFSRGSDELWTRSEALTYIYNEISNICSMKMSVFIPNWLTNSFRGISLGCFASKTYYICLSNQNAEYCHFYFPGPTESVALFVVCVGFRMPADVTVVSEKGRELLAQTKASLEDF